MLRKTSLNVALAATLLVPVGIELTHAAAADDVTPPPVPSTLEVGEGQQAYLIGHASGTQNYSCLPSSSGFAWTLYGPQATLFEGDASQLITHYLSANPDENGTPRATWQHSRDTSTVWAVAVATSSDAAFVAPGAIPWLRLDVAGREYGPGAGDKLFRTTSIQRVNTAGGIAPSTGCSSAADVGKKLLVPYTADYVFYRIRG